MNKLRFMRFAAFALCIEFALIVVLFVSTSNPPTSSVSDVLPTQMVLPIASTPLPENQSTSSVNSQIAAPAPVDAAGHSVDPNNQAVSVSAGGASNTSQTAPTITPAQQVAASPSNVSTQPTPIPAPPQMPVPNQVVIQFKPDAKPEEINAYVASVGGTVNHKIDALNTVVINLPAAQVSQTLPSAAAIVNSEPDYFVSALVDVPPNDALYSQQWSLPVIGAPDAWKALPSNAPKVTIAVIDSGICADHPDLAGRILSGWDFVENDAVPQDEYGHGCGVAGIIAANIDDGAGIAGVAPNTMILPLRVLDAKGVGTYSNVAAAIVRATDEGAQIINLSVGGSNPSSLLENAINYAISKQVTVVAAAGNTGGNVLYPAAYAPVIAVGSVDANLQRSSFSSYLPQLDTLAPGSNILTTALNQSYKTVSGTSFAAAEVSGILALDLGAGYPFAFDGSVLTFGPHDALQSPPTPSGTLMPGDAVDGEVQPLAVIGADSRVRVTDTTVTPNSAVVLIIFSKGSSGQYICSGSIIAPQYVLTAGHCAYDEGVYSTNFIIYPGRDGATIPFGSRTVIATYIPPTWISTATGNFGNANLDYDWSLLKLNSPVSASIQPFAVGAYSDAFLTSGINFTDAGYPGDKCRYSIAPIYDYCPSSVNPRSGAFGQGDTQWTASNSIFTALTPYRVGSKIDTYGGQSGSPFYYVDTSQPTNSILRNVVTAVLSYSEVYGSTTCYNTPGAQCPEADSGNYFRRVTTDMLEAMVTFNDVPFVNPACYAVNIATSGSGTVSRSQPRSVGMGCATGTYTIGSSFGLSAVASPGYVFSGWSSGTSSNDVNTTYTVTGAATITATFVPQPPPAPSTVLPIGYYDDQDPNIGYSSGWVQYTGAGPSANTLAYTNVQNAIATFAFKGTGIILYRSLSDNRGPMEVCVDTACQTITSYNATLVWTVPTATIDSGSEATRVVRIRNLSSNYIDLDAVQVLGTAGALGIGTYQENNGNLTYNGNWTPSSTSLALGGSRKYTRDANGRVSFGVDSSVGRVVIFRTTYLTGVYGSLEVWVDGSKVTTIDNTSSSFLFGMPFVFAVSPVGHTIELRNVGSTYSDLDQITLLAAAAPLSTNTYQETEPSLIYNGNWTSSSQSSALGGSRKYTNDPNATVTFNVDSSVWRITIYRTTYVAGVYGSLQVFVDGVATPFTTINNTSSAFLFGQPFSFTITPGNHSITLKNVGSTYSDLDQITLQAPPSALALGSYQETDPNLVYSGTWTPSSTSLAFGDSRIYTNDPNGSVTFSINNSVGRVTIYRSTYMAGVYGSLQVFVDGTPVTTINNTSTTFLFRQPFTFEVTPGSHIIVLKNVGTTYSDLDQITLQTATAPLAVGSYQETEPNLIYNGVWTDSSTPSAFGNARRYTNDPNATVSFKITNAVGLVTIYRTTYVAGVYGSMQVFVDGTAVTTINNTSAAFLFQQPFTFAVIPGNHTITLKNVGTTYSDLDQITLQPPLSVGVYQETDPNLVYAGTWTSSSTTMALGGARKYTSDPNGSVTFTIDSTVGQVTIYRTTYAAGVYGSFQVFLDNSPTALTTINNTSSAFLFQQPFSFNVTPGSHLITLKNVGMTYSDLDQITLSAPGSQLEPLMPTATLTETVVTATVTLTPTSVTATATATPLISQTPVETATPTQTVTEPTQTAAPTETVVPSVVPTDTAAPTATDIPTNTAVPTEVPSSTPLPTAIPSSTPAPTDVPTSTPVPTDVPTEIPSAG